MLRPLWSYMEEDSRRGALLQYPPPPIPLETLQEIAGRMWTDEVWIGPYHSPWYLSINSNLRWVRAWKRASPVIRHRTPPSFNAIATPETPWVKYVVSCGTIGQFGRGSSFGSSSIHTERQTDRHTRTRAHLWRHRNCAQVSVIHHE